MLDFEKYIQGNGLENRDGTIILEIEDIEHDLFTDINSILKDHSGRHFIADRFKFGRHCIDIISRASISGK
jgi:hypothetical protein